MNLAILIDAGVEIEARGPDLVVRGAITPAIVECVRLNKAALLVELAGRVCGRCFHYWSFPNRQVGHCLLHHFETHPGHDCGRWRPWSGHSYSHGEDHKYRKVPHGQAGH